MTNITGADLIRWGYTPGPWFKDALAHAASLAAMGIGEDTIREQIGTFEPVPAVTIPRHERGVQGYTMNLEANTAAEHDNRINVDEHMTELMRVPTIKAGAVMPDACPAGSAKGTIPVGGIVACENAIHPGFHSADICCSMAITTLGDAIPSVLLDAAMAVTHFGPGGRLEFSEFPFSRELADRIMANPITAPLIKSAYGHFGTQGDGNHFFSVGRLKSTGQVAMVTHHGSRVFGARVYKAGQRIAEAHTKKIAPSVPKHQAWIVADSQDGCDYWEALQICREWTKLNHFAIHDAVARRVGLLRGDRFWNEHNFVFQKSDGLFYHAKGATPAYPDFAADTNGLTLIPMNMAEPILITRGLNASNGLGFSPHGAGRNLSRTGFKKTLGEHESEAALHAAAGLPAGLDARWFSGTPDTSEMPGGYKDAESVRRQIRSFGLAEIVDEVLPYGCIMAGEIDWRKAGKSMGDAA
jgi:RNA-splicing ligase RtcB